MKLLFQPNIKQHKMGELILIIHGLLLIHAYRGIYKAQVLIIIKNLVIIYQ
ncbi:unnamed protein product [Paramecium sonneborni]|uniref:Uncharacterized protein n=1 Tax=Paramecium sonneborni TaxID=65129 RepID=A0A8S1RAP5_9CILI|nr:unnamed protein product [Paramecium sonneborni]